MAGDVDPIETQRAARDDRSGRPASSSRSSTERCPCSSWWPASRSPASVDALGTGLIILAGSVATWLAHAYATIMGEGVTAGEKITPRQVAHRLRDDGPIVLAGLPAAIAVGGATVGLWTLPTAITATNTAGVLVLAITGLAAARNRGSGPLATLVSVIVATSLGLGVIAVELALHD